MLNTVFYLVPWVIPNIPGSFLGISWNFMDIPDFFVLGQLQEILLNFPCISLEISIKLPGHFRKFVGICPDLRMPQSRV